MQLACELLQAMSLREDRYGKAGYTPSGDTKDLFPGTYYLAEVSTTPC